MELKAGTRWKSAVCTAELVVVRAPSAAGELACGGVAVVPHTADSAPSGTISHDFAEGVLIGKRYMDETTGLEVLGAKPGKGSLSFDGRALTLKDAKPLPASD